MSAGVSEENFKRKFKREAEMSLERLEGEFR